MSDIKKPKWDGCKNKSTGQKITSNMNPSVWDKPLSIPSHVVAIYEKVEVSLQIQEKIKDDSNNIDDEVFTAIITGFSPSTQTYKDLKLNDVVEISRKYICRS